MAPQFGESLDVRFGLPLGGNGVAKFRRDWELLARKDLQRRAGDSVSVVAAANAKPGGEVSFGHWQVVRCLSGDSKPAKALALGGNPLCNPRGGASVGAVRQVLRVGLFLAQGPQFSIDLGEGSPGGIKLAVDLGQPGIIGTGALGGMAGTDTSQTATVRGKP